MVSLELKNTEIPPKHKHGYDTTLTQERGYRTKTIYLYHIFKKINVTFTHFIIILELKIYFTFGYLCICDSIFYVKIFNIDPNQPINFPNDLTS